VTSTLPGGDVRGFYRALGVALPEWAQAEASVSCFAHPEAHARQDRDASCSVNVESGLWNCHGCGEGGGPYDAAAARADSTGGDGSVGRVRAGGAPSRGGAHPGGVWRSLTVPPHRWAGVWLVGSRSRSASPMLCAGVSSSPGLGCGGRRECYDPRNAACGRVRCCWGWGADGSAGGSRSQSGTVRAGCAGCCATPQPRSGAENARGGGNAFGSRAASRHVARAVSASRPNRWREPSHAFSA
jgi:hypothetical protein